MKMKNIVLAFILVTTSIGLLFQIYLYSSRPKYAYININQTFEKFEMKSELENKFIVTKEARQKILDSLAMDLQSLSSHIEKSSLANDKDFELFEIKREDYLKRKKQLEEDNLALTQSYNKQIITQMKKYISDYCSENNYNMVFGEDESGSVLYSVTENDITNEVISYINVKYQGI
jgi:Skp family chaperone for outer membrane proteins